jgi:hypothetical protein
MQPGDQHGKWTVLHRIIDDEGSERWMCRCECGTEAPVHHSNLMSGRSTACRVHPRIKNRLYPKTARGTIEWVRWSAMKNRCLNPTEPSYRYYGARGITVCDRWLGKQDGFLHFLADMGPIPSKSYSIERKDNNGNYEPGNCKWATQKEQARNKRTTVKVTVGEETHCISEWAEIRGISRDVIYKRIRDCGWDPVRAITQPLLVRNR